MRPNLSRVTAEAPQPAADRVLHDPEPPSDHPMPLAGHLGQQRRADHRDLVAPPQQAQIGQQHVRHAARPTDRAPRPQPPQPPARTTHRPRRRVPPRTQLASAARARQAPAPQIRLDPRLLGAYHQHRVPPPASREPSQRQPPSRDGRALTRLRTPEPSPTPPPPSTTSRRPGAQQRAVMATNSVARIMAANIANDPARPRFERHRTPCPPKRGNSIALRPHPRPNHSRTHRARAAITPAPLMTNPLPYQPPAPPGFRVPRT